LASLFDFFAEFTISHFRRAGGGRVRCSSGRRKIRLGTMDLKIAATALVNNALLLSANRRDFERVPGLRVENWLGLIESNMPVQLLPAPPPLRVFFQG